MTMHMSYHHECPKCGTSYIPYNQDVPCPKCGLVEVERFDYLVLAAASANINFWERGKYTPNAWYSAGTGDRLLLYVFYVLDFHREAKGGTFSANAQTFFEKMDFGEQQFMRPYLIRLAIEVSATIENSDQITETRSRAASLQDALYAERGALPESAAKVRLRESYPRVGLVEESDGVWLAYALDDGRRVLFQKEDGSYLLVAADGAHERHAGLEELVSHLNSNT